MNITDALVAIGTTNSEALMGILDYVAPRFKRPVVIAESCSGWAPWKNCPPKLG